MRKVRLSFTLVGKSEAWKRNMPKGTSLEVSNQDTLDYVKEVVTNQFGDRALVVVNEHKLSNNSVPYPSCYAAGWFISDDDVPEELVLVDHGPTMEAATKALMESVKLVDWNSVAKRV